MGMIASYYRISTELIEHLISHPEEVETFLYEVEEVSEKELDIDKAWHGIYFLLTGEAQLGAAVDSTEGDAVLGGRSLGQDLGMEPCRYLQSDEVKEIYDTLKNISVNHLSEQFDAKAFNEADIYPMYGEWTEEDKAYILDNYQQLVQYFKEAAQNEEGMLLLIH
ncbi:YfbM family protein [Bacillus sp. REN10]|uniref:YfbM family protein n=1 Tax=Bacillus sp. REN10 TaxID=2782541 RepID=UPI00193C1119|nr:YfbM family protein [Bacillus sp. REN10]